MGGRRKQQGTGLPIRHVFAQGSEKKRKSESVYANSSQSRLNSWKDRSSSSAKWGITSFLQSALAGVLDKAKGMPGNCIGIETAAKGKRDNIGQRAGVDVRKQPAFRGGVEESNKKMSLRAREKPLIPP